MNRKPVNMHMPLSKWFYFLSEFSILKEKNLSPFALFFLLFITKTYLYKKEGKRKVLEVTQSQTAALPRHQEEEKTDKSKQAQIEQPYEKH